MSLKTRLVKLEQKTKKNELVLICVNNGESNEEAYKRCFPNEKLNFKNMYYINEIDAKL
ncbi:hypothetical protein [Methylomonas methanica]|uniref:Uncharacterized protein n=1 Tax=Methylomonas methanica (strain DSM 25384 / MC09) TaxID=857087 RepID=G0A7J8_METMM|nr:hypothetical protein [Methylomonas methanica]AEG00668.1 hypothetical protein Metme_2264 [Methylomonas methanica MC09]